MFVKTLILFLFITTTTSEVDNQDIQICGQKNPNLNECLRDSFNKLHDLLFEGIPILGVPSIKSIALNNVTYEDQQEIQIIANKSLLHIFDYYITNVRLIESAKNLYFKYEIGPCKIKTDFYFNGKFIIPLKAKGTVTMNSHKLTADGVLYYEIVQKYDNKYVRVEWVKTDFSSYNFDIDIQTTEADNVTRGIINTFNSYFKENISNFTDMIIPNIERSFSIFLMKYADNLVKNFEYKYIFHERGKI